VIFPRKLLQAANPLLLNASQYLRSALNNVYTHSTADARTWSRANQLLARTCFHCGSQPQSL